MQKNLTTDAPCLQAISKTIDDSNKLPDERDRFLFNYMVFCKKKYPDLWEKKVLDGARKYILYDEWEIRKMIKLNLGVSQLRASL